ncbi:TPA: flagellar biosynthesis protein [Clostridium botulinum]|uniref:TIGR02530 family flagellar biosynthesis protein n=1 Tax=Clostridium botulinum TaxID=1491 RepID=UPI0004A55B6D|nr:TIGR02530 family flagellar biosynthesis protein [Clostridium botulinum]KEJ02766.1 flagellar biosynthesis protein [Clostridium botulinum A2B3 87]HDK7159418.1 flagellar biosynthesis protein [Clostridium botulinum]HDK7177390.1 flagellar biosynthesis protein [Clostridium botulinum]HDK7189011.1 flagellar biosynthesis protein [Clostridium botulinum]HDK7216232.1 flagellar biosynthesis protein [Clostridium botulinum]
MSFKIINGKLHLIEDYNYASLKNKNIKSEHKVGSFEELLNKKLNDNDKINNKNKEESFIISKHAFDRLKSRNINLSEEDMNSINKAINIADKKGSRECLILCKDAALITSIKNRTIITAMTKEESKDNVFTNIDSAVII